MQSDVDLDEGDVPTATREPGSLPPQRPRKRVLCRLISDVGSHASDLTDEGLREGPDTTERVLEWPSMLLDRLASRPDFGMVLQALGRVLVVRGLVVHSDYSGMGGAEISMSQLV